MGTSGWEGSFLFNSKFQYSFALSLHHSLCFASALLHLCSWKGRGNKGQAGTRKLWKWAWKHWKDCLSVQCAADNHVLCASAHAYTSFKCYLLCKANGPRNDIWKCQITEYLNKIFYIWNVLVTILTFYLLSTRIGVYYKTNGLLLCK